MRASSNFWHKRFQQFSVTHYRPNKSDRFGSLMLGNVNRGLGCLWLGTPPAGIGPLTIGIGGVPDTGILPGRPPVGAVKNVELEPVKPGLSGGRGGRGGIGLMGDPGLGGTLGRGRDGPGPIGRLGDGGRGAVKAPSVVTIFATGTGELRANEHWVLQILSLLTASTPTSAISCLQLLTRSD
jgi:hypothetical protein